MSPVDEEDQSHVSTVPEAVVALLARYFGTASAPDFSRTPGVADRNPFPRQRTDLERLMGTIEDLTDLNHDLGWSWWVRSVGEALNVRVSFVGPYALILDAKGTLVDHNAIAALLAVEGFTLLTTDVLTRGVLVWGPEFEATLYEYLCEFDNGPLRHKD